MRKETAADDSKQQKSGREVSPKGVARHSLHHEAVPVARAVPAAAEAPRRAAANWGRERSGRRKKS